MVWLQHGHGPKLKGDSDPTLSLGEIALEAARLLDTLPSSLQVKALLHINAMIQMHEFDQRISEEAAEEQKECIF